LATSGLTRSDLIDVLKWLWLMDNLTHFVCATPQFSTIDVC